MLPSPALDEALRRLPGRKFIFTNGSTAHADRVTARLGVGHHFDGVFDIIAADYRPKPDPATYDRLILRHGIDPSRAAMVEDLPRNLRVGTYSDDFSSRNRDGFHLRFRGIHRHDFSVAQH